METPTPSPQPPKPRAPSPYKSVPCPSSFDDVCTKMITYGKEFEKWGNAVLKELDDIKAASSGGGGAGGPPQDATQPPPPPFHKP
jgi:hypothetical protein